MTEYSKESQYDKQGSYFWSLVKQAGWDRERVTMLMLKKFDKSHWNVLAYEEKRQLISTMKRYADKEKHNREKKLRQKIYALWISTGHTKDELHDLLTEWDFGDSLRLCKLPTLLKIYSNVKAICR